MKTTTQMNNKELAYLFARVVMGTSMFGHGLVRLPKLDAFSAWMMKSFEQSLLPAFLVKPFSLSLPLLEFIIGFLLLAGWFTKQAIATGLVIMIILIFGSCLIEQWEYVSFQMFYGLFFCLLLAYLQYNKYSLDDALTKRSGQ